MGEGGPKIEGLLRKANERLVRSALAAKEAAQREQALREEIQAQTSNCALQTMPWSWRSRR